MLHRKKSLARLFTLYIPLGLFLAWTVFPIYWILNTALKPNLELLLFPFNTTPIIQPLRTSRQSFSAPTLALILRTAPSSL
jgi:ABC-type glycerol-3-phosphate transport system permease component